MQISINAMNTINLFDRNDRKIKKFERVARKYKRTVIQILPPFVRTVYCLLLFDF